MSAKKQKRSFGLSSEDVAELTAEFEATKTLPNPYRSGAYAHAVSALVTLGTNTPHSFAKVHQAFKRAAGAEWYAAWTSQEKRNEETGLDADGRLVQNLRVLQRTADYGLKLLEVGQKVMGTKGVVIDLSRDDKGRLLVALNTRSDAPVKPGRPERAKTPVAPKAAKAAGKPQEGRKASGKARQPSRKAKQFRKAGKA